MKSLCAIFVVFLCSGTLLTNASPLKEQLVGASKCTWGPSYWCTDLSSAKDCKAVRHCIQTVWEKHAVPTDDDSICKICKDMVTQARDQLRSNETMDELRQVFEGSCNLIPIKVVKKECTKLADDFIPELVEALSSQMNPDQVCSVAGLCNNAKIDELLMKYFSGALEGTLPDESEEAASEEFVPVLPGKPVNLSCTRCNYISTVLTNKFKSTSRDEVLENMLRLCGQMSSFSDACSSIVLTYFNDFYGQIEKDMKPNAICHMSGTCSAKYHQHAGDVAEPEEHIEALVANGGDDIPCELCEQLVRHFREVLIANTTEAEFKLVLEGLCKQTKQFKEECLSIVDQYYDVIYNTLVKDLNDKDACFLMGVCPKGKTAQTPGDIRPLLPALEPVDITVIIRKMNSGLDSSEREALIANPLPIDHLLGAANPSLLVENGQLCTLCEYMLHFIQEELSLPATEDTIIEKVNGICAKFPSSVKDKCHDFIVAYGDAIIALLIQDLDPREICPKMQMCPHNDNHQDMEVFSPNPSTNGNVDPKPAVDESDKPTCPLCLFAVEQAQEKIKNDKSKRNIKNVLDHLCVHLPNKLKSECVDFIETYSSELIDMLITDFKPDEICVAIKLCPKTNNYLQEMGLTLDLDDSDNVALNEILAEDDVSFEIAFAQDMKAPLPNCLLCEELIKIAESRINKHTTKEDILNALEHSCDKLNKKLQPKCHNFLDKYGDKISELLLKEMDPKLICLELGMCLGSEQEDLEVDEALKYDVIAAPNAKVTLYKPQLMMDADLKETPSCVLCEFIMAKLEMELKNKSSQAEIKHAIEQICNIMPKTVRNSCDKFIDQYANVIFVLIGTIPPKEICTNMEMCFSKPPETLKDEASECGVCHGALEYLIPYYVEHPDYTSVPINEMISVGCGNLPAKYYDICSKMINIYGHSIVHLYEKHKNESQICSKIGKCFNYENSKLAFARISA